MNMHALHELPRLSRLYRVCPTICIWGKQLHTGGAVEKGKEISQVGQAGAAGAGAGA